MNHPSSFILQWHITERCNWACKHCYQNDNTSHNEASFDTMLNYFQQFLYCINKWRLPKQKARINFTGGEPFVRKDFMDFLEHINKYSHLFNLGILSNGSFLDRALVKKLKALNVVHYQVSLEGTKEYNDKIRGEGAFDQVINSIKLLAKEGLTPPVSLTLTRENKDQVPELANILYKAGAKALSTRRFVPLGRGEDLKEQLLEPSELKNYYLKILQANNIMQQKQKGFRINIGCESSIITQELEKKENPEKGGMCGVYDGRIVALMPDGTLYPCRRLPINIGNLSKNHLYELWNSENLRQIRDISNAHPFCKSCDNFSYCYSGAKCVTYAHTGKLHVPDVQCWKYRKKIPKT